MREVADSVRTAVAGTRRSLGLVTYTLIRVKFFFFVSQDIVIVSDIHSRI